MKNRIVLFASTLFMLLAFSLCRNTTSEKQPETSRGTSPVTEGLILVGREMITDVILRPDTLGDPWEVEKVKGFDGNIMFKTLLENIYSKKVTVYSAITEEPVKPEDVKKLVEEFGSDLKKIAKLQFCEDWFLDPATGNIIRKTRSIILGYEVPRESGLPASYKAMFRIKP